MLIELTTNLFALYKLTIQKKNVPNCKDNQDPHVTEATDTAVFETMERVGEVCTAVVPTGMSYILFPGVLLSLLLPKFQTKRTLRESKASPTKAYSCARSRRVITTKYTITYMYTLEN